jgi:DNA-binding SARP family transcriptional activator
VTIVRLRILGESVVQIGERCITPNSPRLFAFALYFGHAEGRAVHKSELLELLFPDVADEERASHNLRQLLYRLRLHGAPIVSDGDRLRLSADCITSTLDEFTSMPRDGRVGRPASALSILPAYEPRISRQLSDWIEMVRSKTQARVRARLRDDLRVLERDCDWERVVTVGRTMQELHGSSEEIVRSVAQALLMRGRKHDALDVIDAFLGDCDLSALGSLRLMRGRIARSEQPTRVLESTFHGRRDVMHALAEQWCRATESTPQLAVVTGPAGIGKTRLAQEFGSYVQLHNGYFLHYRCDRSDSARPYALFRSLIPQLRRMRGSLGTSPELQRHLDLVASDVTAQGVPEPAASEAMRAEIQMAVIDLLEAVSAEKPLLIVVDDAQLQDSASRSVTKAFIANGGHASVMIVWCNRTIGSDDVGSAYAFRGQVHRLTPLSEQDSLAVLLELLPAYQSDRDTLRAWAGRAGGNPYYLHAMAHDRLTAVQEGPATFDIRRFAASTYYGLGTDARALYDTCVLLGPLASLQRVQRVVAVDGLHLISALRELETNGMICSTGGELRCAHALLEEASLGLIPSTVAALLHARIATELEKECAAHSYPTALTWAAAEHWIAIGDVGAAARLLRHCASQAAALGEPSTAAQALLHIPLQSVGLAERASILSQLAEYAEAASEFRQVAGALRSLHQTKKELGCPPGVLREIEFHIIEAELRHGASPTPAIHPLQEFVADSNAPGPLRIRAGACLLIAADMNLDEQLAISTYEAIKVELKKSSPSDEEWQRAELVFHTVFGKQDRAFELANALLKQYLRPQISQAAVRYRRNIAYALMRLGWVDLARDVLVADYEFMMSRHVTSEAVYRMILLSEVAIYRGDLEDARIWIDRLGGLVAQDGAYAAPMQAGYFSIAAELALCEERLDQAEAFVDEARRTYPAISSARYAAIELSLRLRIQLRRDGRPTADDIVPKLNDLYLRGRHLGAQDTVVEALWLAKLMAGRADAASNLLRDYLAFRRRELRAPVWTLRSTTASDPAWYASTSD